MQTAVRRRCAGGATRVVLVVVGALLMSTLVAPSADAARRYTVTAKKSASATATVTRNAVYDGYRGKATVRRTARAVAAAKATSTSRKKATSVARSRALSKARSVARKRAVDSATRTAASVARSRAITAAKAAEKTKPPAATPRPTPTPTPTPTPEPSPTSEPTPTPTPTATPEPTPAPEVGTEDACGPTRAKADGSAWSCTFSDDFDGDALDSSKWLVATSEATGLTYGDCWVDRPENLSVADGSLRLTTRMEDEPVTCTAEGKTVTTRYTSGSVTTWGRYTLDRGRVEIRAKMPTTTRPGVQSALWLFPETMKYWDVAGSGEMDIAEFYSQYPDRLIPTMHYATTSPGYTNYFCMVQDPTQWHTYVLEWDRDRIRVEYDGAVCLDHEITPVGQLLQGQPFDQDYTINLTQMLGSGANAPTSATQLPATMEVDHVRVWQ